MEEKKGTASSNGYFHEITVSEQDVAKFDREAVKIARKKSRKLEVFFSPEELAEMKIKAFPWESQDKVDLLRAPRSSVYARKCEIREVPLPDVKAFLESYHLQGNVKGQKICLGLYYQGELVEVMTFGTPRYNKKFQYELLRLCTKAGVSVVGGSSRLFSYFQETYKPSSVISYCNAAKFDGQVYLNLGFTLKTPGAPTRHWWHPDRKIHITDNFLRSKGFDLLFGHIWGKYGIGTDNDELMRAHGFVEIYDAGQSTYVWTPSS